MDGEINKISLERMTNGAHYQFVSQILTKAKANATVVEKASAQVGVFEKKVAAEDEALKLSRKSQYTEDIAAADSERDTLYSAYCTTVRAFVGNSNAEKDKAARTLQQHITDYAIDTQMQLDRETGMLVNFDADLAGKYAEQVATLGLTAIVAALTAANDTVNELTAQRTDERTGKVAGALKAARIASDAAYRNLVRRIEALWVVEYAEAYDEFIAYANELVKHYKQEALTKRNSKKKTDETTATTKPDETEETKE